jgi:ATP-binding protein involved in chromosome partitioning
MFVKLGVPILGVVENMSYFADASGARIALFGEGGGVKLATTHQTKLLAQIPLEMSIRECTDSGTVYGGLATENYRKIAENLKL